MASLFHYADDPERMALMRYGKGAANEGHYIGSVQGSVGGNSPMFLWSNEYDYTAMKHGGADDMYNPGINVFAHPFVDAGTQRAVRMCTRATKDPYGCLVSGHRRLNAESQHHSLGYSYETGARR